MGAVILFSNGDEDLAAVYMHGDDGDEPEQLAEFFTQEDSYIVSDPRYRHRFDDPEYLAARFVAYQMSGSPSGTGVGVTVPTNRDLSNYRVLCVDTTRPHVVKLDD